MDEIKHKSSCFVSHLGVKLKSALTPLTEQHFNPLKSWVNL